VAGGGGETEDALWWVFFGIKLEGWADRFCLETIMKAVKVITRDLMSRTDKDINVWFTGG
jgi:hypothetical protein